MSKLMSTREVSKFLNVNEKMVYTLVSEKGLPASKITGKWLFPQHLVEQWVETHTLNFPKPTADAAAYKGLLVVAGSNDLLLDRVISLFNTLDSQHLAVFGNLGSMGGLRALRRGLCHIAGSHLLQEDETEYNFAYASSELEDMPAMVNFCRREQGLIVSRKNPKKIAAIVDLGRPGLRMVNRQLGTGTRLLLDRELTKAGIKGERIDGYANEVQRHLDVGLEVLAGRADVGPGIRPVAALLGLSFIPLRWERFDLMVAKEHFFDEAVQRFLGLLHDARFQRMVADGLEGYDLSMTGKMVFPPKPAAEKPIAKEAV
jgi:putative molybdopterin biosynthesis protein